MQPKFNAETQQYFDTLPPYIQEAVHMSGIQVYSKSELEQLVKNIQQENENKG